MDALPMLLLFQLDASVGAGEVRSVVLAVVADGFAMVAEKVDPFRLRIQSD